MLINITILKYYAFVVLPSFLFKVSKKRGKGLLNKAESIKEFATHTSIKYASCMDPLLEGDRLKLGEIDNLCYSNDHEARTDFGSMSDKEKMSIFMHCLVEFPITSLMNICING